MKPPSMVMDKKPFKYIKRIAYGRHISNGKMWDVDAWRHWYRWVLENKR